MRQALKHHQSTASESCSVSGNLNFDVSTLMYERARDLGPERARTREVTIPLELSASQKSATLKMFLDVFRTCLGPNTHLLLFLQRFEMVTVVPTNASPTVF